MNYNNPSEIDRMRELIGFKAESDKSSTSGKAPVVEYKSKGADGKTYGIVNEGNKFYIKVAPKKDTEVLVEDFDYIGGFNNRKQNEYNSFNMASKQLDLKLMSINEAYSTKVAISQPKTQEADWQVNETKEMRNAINRFKQISNNVEYILAEDKNGFTLSHTLPEAPASHPSKEKVNSPFTDTAVADGDKDFKKTATQHEKVGPFNIDGKATDKDMESDKMPGKGNHDKTYSEDAKYVPDGSVADKKPSGGKVVHVNEGKKCRTIKLTEEQVLAWNKSKDFMDKSNGTEIGDTAPYTENPQTQLEEEAGTVHNVDNQNSPTPGTGEIGDTAPFDQKVNEEIVDAADVAGLPDETEDTDFDLPFPEVENQDDEYGFSDSTDFIEDVDGDFEDFDLSDPDDMFNTFESRHKNGRKINETELHDFGKHPAYRKKPMSTPPNIEVAPNGARDWNDDSVKGDAPYGQKIGSSAPFDEKTIDMLTDAIMRQLRPSKK